MESPEMEEEGRGCSQAEGSDPNLRRRKKKKRRQNKRRFSDDQIRLLESMFEAETKPEPVKKVELARELGLQPRQVATWFQNKRARWKAKQIEQEYKALSADYESLKSKFESLEKDKQSLLLQLQRLSNLLEKSTHERSRGSEGLALNSSDGGSEYGRTLCGSEANRGFLKEEPENGGFMCLDGDEEDDKNTRIGHFESDPIPNHMDQQQMEGFSTSPDEEWCSLDSSGLFSDQNCGSSQWWNFWT